MCHMALPSLCAQFTFLRRVKRQRTRNEGQKGSQNREALVWRLIDPDGNTHKAVNLLDWARQNHLQARSSFVRSRRRRTRVAAPSICCAAACILLAAAPTAPPCFGHWRSGCVCCFFFSPLAGTLKKQNAALASPPFICRWQRSAPLQSSPLRTFPKRTYKRTSTPGSQPECSFFFKIGLEYRGVRCPAAV